MSLREEELCGILGQEEDGLDEAEAGITIARRNINNLRCADDTTLCRK